LDNKFTINLYVSNDVQNLQPLARALLSLPAMIMHETGIWTSLEFGRALERSYAQALAWVAQTKDILARENKTGVI
jgi:hypothetical protein